MTPGEISQSRRLEQEERRLGMCSLDAETIARHFGRAKALRDLIALNSGPRLAVGAIGTKGSWTPPA